LARRFAKIFGYVLLYTLPKQCCVWQERFRVRLWWWWWLMRLSMRGWVEVVRYEIMGWRGTVYRKGSRREARASMKGMRRRGVMRMWWHSRRHVLVRPHLSEERWMIFV
jgi:hypothetical protein